LNLNQLATEKLRILVNDDNRQHRDPVFQGVCFFGATFQSHNSDSATTAVRVYETQPTQLFFKPDRYIQRQGLSSFPFMDLTP